MGCSSNSALFGAGHRAINYNYISELQLQIKLGRQLSVQFILRFESSEEVEWGVREQFKSSELGVGRGGGGTRISKIVG